MIGGNLCNLENRVLDLTGADFVTTNPREAMGFCGLHVRAGSEGRNRESKPATVSCFWERVVSRREEITWSKGSDLNVPQGTVWRNPRCVRRHRHRSVPERRGPVDPDQPGRPAPGVSRPLGRTRPAGIPHRGVPPQARLRARGRVPAGPSPTRATSNSTTSTTPAGNFRSATASSRPARAVPS